MFFYVDKNIFITDKEADNMENYNMIKCNKYLLFGSKYIIKNANKSIKNKKIPQIPLELSTIIDKNTMNIENDNYIDLFDDNCIDLFGDDCDELYLCISESNMYGILIKCSNLDECKDTFLYALDSQIEYCHYSLPSEEGIIQTTENMYARCFSDNYDKYYSFHTKSFPVKKEYLIKNCTIPISTHNRVSNFRGIIISQSDYNILDNSTSYENLINQGFSFYND